MRSDNENTWAASTDASKWRHWRRSGAFIVNFEHIFNLL